MSGSRTRWEWECAARVPQMGGTPQHQSQRVPRIPSACSIEGLGPPSFIPLP